MTELTQVTQLPTTWVLQMLVVQLFDVSSGDTVYADVVRSSTTEVEITFGAAPASNDIRVLIIEL